MVEDEFTAALALARQGDEGAFALVYRQVQPGLLRYLRGLSVTAAEDLAADTWLEVVRALDRFVGDAGGFTAWVFTIARRKAIDRSRYEGRRLTRRIDDEPSTGPTVPDPADVVVQADATDAAIALVRTLPPDQAEVILLRVVAGLDIAEVATLLGKSNGAVRVLAHRGLKRLGARLAARSVPEEV
jgi:RNA polymerase sigma-70 factor (ECF subfamily)